MVYRSGIAEFGVAVWDSCLVSELGGLEFDGIVA